MEFPQFRATTKVLTLLAISASLAGCIHFDHHILDEQPLHPVRSLEQHPCCDSLLGLPAVQLPANEYVSIIIDEYDPVLDFRTGKSFARVIELPRLEGEYLLQLDSVVNRPDIDLHPKALYPMVQLLDANLNPIGTFDDEPVDLRQPVLGPSLVRIILTVAEDAGARYAVLYTSKEKTNLGLSTKSPVEVIQKGGFDTMIYTRPTETRFKIQFEPTGMVNMLAFQQQ